MDNSQSGGIKWFHAIGGSGKTTANVAKMFKELGWFVTASDIQFLPPASEIIKKAEIPLVEGYDFKHLTKDFWEKKIQKDLNLENYSLNIPEHPDLCLVVESVSAKNKEYLFAKRKGIKVLPYAQILGEYLVKKNSVVVVGTAGKTTTTSLCVSLLSSLGFNPSYMIGGEVLNLKESLMLTDSHWSILEGDEYHNIELSNGPKFLEYKANYLIITNIGYEHQDIFPTQEDYLKAFQSAVEVIPEDGFIIAKADDENIDRVITKSKCKYIRYKFVEQNEISQYLGIKNLWLITKIHGICQIYNDNKELVLEFKTSLIGDYNLENILASIVLVDEIVTRDQKTEHLLDAVISRGNPLDVVKEDLETFGGVKKRLEVLYQNEIVTVIDDFGVAPSRVKNSLNTLKKNFEDYKIICVFEPNSGSRPSDQNVFKEMYKSAFRFSNLVIIPELSGFNENLANTKQVVKWLKNLAVPAVFIPNEELVDHLLGLVKNYKILIVFFSSYRLTKDAHDLVESLRKLS